MSKSVAGFGAVCPVCGHTVTHTIDSRAHKQGRRRRRRCDSCDYRWSTLEVDMKTFTALSSSIEEAHTVLVRVREILELWDSLLLPGTGHTDPAHAPLANVADDDQAQYGEHGPGIWELKDCGIPMLRQDIVSMTCSTCKKTSQAAFQTTSGMSPQEQMTTWRCPYCADSDFTNGAL